MFSGCGQSARSVDGTTGGTGGTAWSTAGTGGSAEHGGTAGDDAGGASAAQPGGSSDEFFVEARVEGELVRLDVNARAFWFQGLARGNLYVEAETEEVGWALLVPNHDGANSCGAGTITLIHYDGDDATYHMSDPFLEVQHGCSLLVDHAAPAVGDVMQGTFAGELTTILAGPYVTISVTEGAFRVPRIADGLPE